MAGTTRTQSPTSQPAFDETRQELGKLVDDLNYHILNGISGNALPALAQGTTATKAKTVNSVNYFSAGVPKTKAGTDDLWTLSGTTVAVSSFQKYLLLLDAAGTASVQEGVQSTVGASSVKFGQLPASGKAIIGILTIATDASHTFVPGTTALNAAGITATFSDGLDPAILLAAKVTL